MIVAFCFIRFWQYFNSLDSKLDHVNIIFPGTPFLRLKKYIFT